MVDDVFIINFVIFWVKVKVLNFHFLNEIEWGVGKSLQHRGGLGLYPLNYIKNFKYDERI